MRKHKKVLWIVFAVLFVVVLFFLKNKTTFVNGARSGGLVYNGTETLADLVNKDTDLDGIPNWEESLWGTDPTKKDTDGDGIPDNIAIEKIKAAQVNDKVVIDDAGERVVPGTVDENNLTKTDKLSREIFSTIATLNQAGDIDQATIDKLSSSLVDGIQNSTSGKVYTTADIKVIKDDSVQAMVTYNSALNKVYSQNPIKYTVLDVMQKFIIDENNVDESVLPQLDPLIKQTNDIIAGMLKIGVPPSLAALHLELINQLQKLSENISDIRMFDTDIVVAMGGISQYQTNTDNTQTAANNLANAITQKLRN